MASDLGARRRKRACGIFFRRESRALEPGAPCLGIRRAALCLTAAVELDPVEEADPMTPPAKNVKQT